MATYQMTGAAISACNQTYTGVATYVGDTDSSYSLSGELGDTLARLRQGSTILYQKPGAGVVGIYDTTDTDNTGDVSTPVVTDVSAPSGSGSGGLLLKYKQQQ